MIKVLHLLSTLATYTVANDWRGCYLPSETVKGLKSGERTAVCLTVGDDGDWATGISYNRYAFVPKADEYSRLTIEGSYKSLVESRNIDVSVFASSQQSLGYLRMYYDTTFGIFPHLTAIIDVKDGIVRGIAWDDACMFCAVSRCVENTYAFDGESVLISEPSKGCYYTKEECNIIVSNGGDECDLTLHVVWTGTDLNGNYLTSSNRRYSAFNPKQIRDQLSDAINSITPDVDWPWL